VAGLNLMGRGVVRPGGAFDLDPLVVTIDVRELGITGYQAGDWLRAERHVAVPDAADSSLETLRVVAECTDPGRGGYARWHNRRNRQGSASALRVRDTADPRT
jgi:hypothetical protein